MTLAEFLAARLGEREAQANGVHDLWQCGSVSSEGEFDPDLCTCGDPARVLRDVEADREILAMYEEQPGYDLPQAVTDDMVSGLRRERDEAVKDALHEVVKIRAARFSDHPDYDEAWRP